MKASPLPHHTLNLLQLSAQHLLDTPSPSCIQEFQQRWQSAQSHGDLQAQQAVRTQVSAMGRQLQKQRYDPQAKALWLALMSLRCSMLFPRLRP